MSGKRKYRRSLFADNYLTNGLVTLFFKKIATERRHPSILSNTFNCQKDKETKCTHDYLDPFIIQQLFEDSSDIKHTEQIETVLVQGIVSNRDDRSRQGVLIPRRRPEAWPTTICFSCTRKNAIVRWESLVRRFVPPFVLQSIER